MMVLRDILCIRLFALQCTKHFYFLNRKFDIILSLKCPNLVKAFGIIRLCRWKAVSLITEIFSIGVLSSLHPHSSFAFVGVFLRQPIWFVYSSCFVLSALKWTRASSASIWMQTFVFLFFYVTTWGIFMSNKFILLSSFISCRLNFLAMSIEMHLCAICMALLLKPTYILFSKWLPY